MAQTTHKHCFGTMFPDVLHIENDQPQRGKVFCLQLERAGGLWRRNREITADIEQWDDCRNCPEFNSCYKLCMAKMTLAAAIIDE